MQVIFIILAPKNIILYMIQPDSTKFEGKYFYKLIQSKGWKHASWRQTQNETQLFKVSDQIWHKNDQNEMKLHGKYDYECIRNSLSSYPVLSH